MPDGSAFHAKLPPDEPGGTFITPLQAMLRENAAHNRRLLATQVRVSGGATEAANMMGENGRMTWQRVRAVLNPQWLRATPKPAYKAPQPEAPAKIPACEQRAVGPRDRRDALLLEKLRRVALAGDPLPWLADLADLSGHSSQLITCALQRLERGRDIVVELSPHRPGFRRQVRVTVHGYGVAKTPGWKGAQ